jgi:hypothetical protein
MRLRGLGKVLMGLFFEIEMKEPRLDPWLLVVTLS